MWRTVERSVPVSCRLLTSLLSVISLLHAAFNHSEGNDVGRMFRRNDPPRTIVLTHVYIEHHVSNNYSVYLCFGCQICPPTLATAAGIIYRYKCTVCNAVSSSDPACICIMSSSFSCTHGPDLAPDQASASCALSLCTGPMHSRW